jgi:Leucine-rich repeat (LRR) protein
VLWLFYDNEAYELNNAQAEIVTLEENVSTLESNISALEAALDNAAARGLTLETEPLVTFPDANLKAAIHEAVYYVTTPSAQGGAIFENICAMCHTIGDGILVGPDLKYVTSRRDRDWLISFITSPEQIIVQEDPIAIQLVEEFDGMIMPTFGLSEQEVEAALMYIELDTPQVPSVDRPEGPIYTYDLETVTTLDARERGISDLTSLEYCLNLQELHLEDNKISDISVLASLTNLSGLHLTSNKINDISALAGLTNLEVLNLGNSVIVISEQDVLTKLETLILGENDISDLSIMAGLTNLLELNLWGNNISDISVLAGLSDLQGLDLGDNNISDISALAGLSDLQRLDLGDNNISDISALAGLSDLQGLDLGENNISDISALVANSGLSAGDTVNLSGNPLSTTSVDVYIPQLEERGVNVIQ